jgi:DNA-binding MarR family transcriptional regulator
MSSRQPEKHHVPVAFLLAQVGARAAQEFGKALAPLGFAPPDAGILRLLNRSPGISQQELAGKLEMHASRLVAVIDALEERGLVARETKADDRRIYSLRLTDAGREALSAIGRVARVHEDAVCAGLSAAERQQLGEALQKIADRYGLTPGVHPGYRTLEGRQGGGKPAQTAAGAEMPERQEKP